ncbi:MAG: helicase [Phycisphaerales bacterium]|nr:MAG: helicase [Phycisphaerales bacterium]
MPNRTSSTGSELFIVDNSDADWKVSRYLHDWCQLCKSIDIATGYFEIGALLALKEEWQKVDHVRVLMGDEVSLRTHDAFVRGLAAVENRLDRSLETEKLRNDFLVGVPAIVKAIADRKIKCRVYRKDKFHAKAYITHARMEVVGSSALVGSSNFTLPGITQNIELNVQITGRPVTVLQEWYEEHWRDAEDVTSAILRVIERHSREYKPFDVYAKALAEFFRAHEMTGDEWDQAGSRMFPVLDQYQREGYRNLLKVAETYNGAFLCDGVGLGKTFIGLMLIERLIRDKKNVMLLVPKSAREAVWEPALRRYLPNLHRGFANLLVFSHTDLQRGGEFPEDFERMREQADAIVIDEAHHFRNPGTLGQPAQEVESVDKSGRIRGEGRVRPSRYRQLKHIIDGPNGDKQVYFLTATPINNKLADFRHMVELFCDGRDDYFARVGIHSLRGHFVKMERDLRRLTQVGDSDGDAATDLAEAERVLAGDQLFHALVVQRSRAYVRRSQLQSGASVASFPEREPPHVAEYSVKKTYGRLLKLIDDAFNKNKPLFVLAMYYPLFYYKGPEELMDRFAENRQKQVVSLIRVQFLKRFESSARAFERSCERLLVRLLAFVTRYSETNAEKRQLERWKGQNGELIDHVLQHQHELWGDDEDDETLEDLVTEELLERFDDLDRETFKIEEMLKETFLDLSEIAKFLDELRKFTPGHDDKLKALLKLLKTDPVLRRHKVLIFTEFADTARYLEQELKSAGITGLDRIDSSTKRKRSDVIRAFAPYYNDSSSAELSRNGVDETRILISTDVLSEGLNLQDATRLINYDLHWNPVRLMQRIGRVDRRLNPEIEAKLLADHPDQQPLRGKVAYWNFLPPDELDELLRLYGRVVHKTLRISRTFGIEGRKLLRPDDDYDALREFNEAYEGATSTTEAMHLEFQRLLQDDPQLEARLRALPNKVFSGKEHPTPGTRAVFFCVALPGRPIADPTPAEAAEGLWSIERGPVQWYLYQIADDQIVEDPAQIVDAIRCTPDTPRHCTLEPRTLADIRARVETHVKNTYLKRVQAPVGVKPVIKCWMELS